MNRNEANWSRTIRGYCRTNCVPCPGLNDQTGERAPVVDWLPVIPAASSILSRLAVIVGILPIV